MKGKFAENSSLPAVKKAAERVLGRKTVILATVVQQMSPEELVVR